MTECRRAIVALMPGFAVPCLLFYLGAIGGMQLYHGKVHAESGYPVRLSVCHTVCTLRGPGKFLTVLLWRLWWLWWVLFSLSLLAQGQFNTFDDFGSALQTLFQVMLGGWARTLLGPAGGAGPHGEVDWNVGDAKYGLIDGMEKFKPGPDIEGGPLRGGQVDASAAFTTMSASWYLLCWRLVTYSCFLAALGRCAARSPHGSRGGWQDSFCGTLSLAACFQRGHNVCGKRLGSLAAPRPSFAT